MIDSACEASKYNKTMESGHFTHHSQLQNFEFSVMICILAIFSLYKTIHKSYQIHIKLLLYIGDT